MSDTEKQSGKDIDKDTTQKQHIITETKNV